MKALGILREIQNSPGRESDDALVLKAVMDQLSILKTEVELMTPEEFDRADVSGYSLIVPMCETYSRLVRLRKIEAESGVTAVNPADSVLGCYRTRMLESFARTPGLSYPPTEVRRTTAAANRAAPAFGAPGGWWLKRGDVHNTCAYDVVFAKDWDEAARVCREFESREIKDLAIQRHIDGDLIKFYGVGPGQWFTWFYHDPASARRLPFELEDLAAQAELAAKAVKVEVFGGDAITTPEGKIYIIDINSWPSFARVRAEAAVQIARRLRLRLRQVANGRRPKS
ncbi:MAG: hypothetical protein HY403_08435 [Elusimicrobia bacterium]|nr:hypothetical protein [Elusimicrobiota bacterium]